MKPFWLFDKLSQRYRFYYLSDEVDSKIKALQKALTAIDSLSENCGSSTSWKTIYEQAQAIAKKALLIGEST